MALCSDSKRRLILMRLICGLLLVFASGAISYANAQFVEIRRATVQTIDGVTFSVRLNRSKNSAIQNTRIIVSVFNGSSKAIYIVKRKDLEIKINEADFTIEVVPPYPIPVRHGDFDFIFQRIAARKTAHVYFDLSGSRSVANGTWAINTGIAFVESISGLVPAPSPPSDPAPWRAELYRRMQTVTVGSLTLEVD